MLFRSVTAADDVDGTCDVTVDTSGLDLSKSGSYIVIYSAMDKSGNEMTRQRTVVVK